MQVIVFIYRHSQQVRDQINGRVCVDGTQVEVLNLHEVVLVHPDRKITHQDAAKFVANFYGEGFDGEVRINV